MQKPIHPLYQFETFAIKQAEKQRRILGEIGDTVLHNFKHSHCYVTSEVLVSLESLYFSLFDDGLV